MAFRTRRRVARPAWRARAADPEIVFRSLFTNMALFRLLVLGCGSTRARHPEAGAGPRDRQAAGDGAGRGVPAEGCSAVPGPEGRALPRRGRPRPAALSGDGAEGEAAATPVSFFAGLRHVHRHGRHRPRHHPGAPARRLRRRQHGRAGLLRRAQRPQRRSRHGARSWPAATSRRSSGTATPRSSSTRPAAARCSRITATTSATIPTWAARAKAFSTRVKDVTEFLAGREPADAPRPERRRDLPGAVPPGARPADHPQPPRLLLRSIPGLSCARWPRAASAAAALASTT